MRKQQNGQALIELALVLPIILIIVMGIVEFGRIFDTHLILLNASREGARISAVGGRDADIQEGVISVTPTLDPVRLNISIEPEEDLRQRGIQTRVGVSYNLEIICPVIDVVLPNPFEITAQTTMRVE